MYKLRGLYGSRYDSKRQVKKGVMTKIKAAMASVGVLDFDSLTHISAYMRSSWYCLQNTTTHVRHEILCIETRRALRVHMWSFIRSTSCSITFAIDEFDSSCPFCPLPSRPLPDVPSPLRPGQTIHPCPSLVIGSDVSRGSSSFLSARRHLRARSRASATRPQLQVP